MDEPCDWDVCTEASTPDPVSRLFPRAEKKRRAKPDVSVSDCIEDRAVEPGSQRKPEKKHPTPRREAVCEEDARKISSTEDTLPAQVTQTRKELQDSLPKIPPLSSFKHCRSKFVTFEEAEQDFQDFITTGPGRSVEIIREFRGREDGEPSDQNGHKEYLTLDDDGAQMFTQNVERLKSNFSPPRSISGSSSSESDMEDDATLESSNETTGAENRAVTKPQIAMTHPPSPPTQQASPTKPKAYTPPLRNSDQTLCATRGRAVPPPDSRESALSIKSGRRTNQTAPAPARREESKKMKKETEKQKEKMERDRKREKKEDGDCTDKEDEWCAETYWRACYSAWNDYYASVSPFQEQGYQSYYNVAYNWMAAYRMNAVYMEELMRK